MILDIDHIAFSSLRPVEHSEIFKKLGYEIELYETNLKNLTIKKKFLRKKFDTHDLLLLKTKKGYGIELLNHKNLDEQISNIVPIFENFQRKLVEVDNTKKFKKFEKGKFKELNSPIYFSDSTDGDFIFDTIVVETNQLLASKKFFEILGFKEIEKGREILKMKFNSILTNKSYYIYLQENEFINSSYLDSIGASCIAYVSGSINNDHKIFEENNYTVTPIQSLRFKNKEMNIFFVEGPSKVMIEVISPTKGI